MNDYHSSEDALVPQPLLTEQGSALYQIKISDGYKIVVIKIEFGIITPGSKISDP